MSTIDLTIRASRGTPSTCTPALGALDYDVQVTVTDARGVEHVVQCATTLVPGEHGLTTWGQLDHWLSSPGCALVRAIAGRDPQTMRQICSEIESACVYGVVRELCELDVGDSDAAYQGAEDGIAAVDDLTHQGVEDLRGALAVGSWDAAARNAQAHMHRRVPAYLAETYYTAYQSAASDRVDDLLV